MTCDNSLDVNMVFSWVDGEYRNRIHKTYLMTTTEGMKELIFLGREKEGDLDFEKFK